MPEKRPFFTKVMNLLKLPEDVQNRLEGKRLGYREIEALASQSANQQEPVRTTANQCANHQEPARTSDSPTANQPANQGSPGDNQPKNRVDRVKSAVDKPTPSYPPIRETVDELVKL